MSQISYCKIFPSIGVARVGNSPNEWYVGPEKRWEHPAGPYKDSLCRVKRQGARFRVFAYDKDDKLIDELTDAGAEVIWSVHLVNKKAASRKFQSTHGSLTTDPEPDPTGFPDKPRNPHVTKAADRQKMVLDPGKTQIQGKSQVVKLKGVTFTAFESGSGDTATATVDLGELRTDGEGHLIVLGGSGESGSPTCKEPDATFDNDEWYDNTSDGPVTATVKIKANGQTLSGSQVHGAWVIVGPPRYAPMIDNPISLYDRLYEVRGPGAPATPSFTDDVYPILENAFDMRGVVDMRKPQATQTEHHGTVHSNLYQKLSDPSQAQKPLREAIYSRLAGSHTPAPGSPMPKLRNIGDVNQLSTVQIDIMKKWAAGTFKKDWSGQPPKPAASVTPAGLDRAALENCVGAAFYPGIEAGRFLRFSKKKIFDDAHKAWDPFRLDHTVVKPGDLTACMALPWQTDFFACGGCENMNWSQTGHLQQGSAWWPGHRPVITQESQSGQHVLWRRDLEKSQMVTEWHKLAFIVPSGGDYRETEFCEPIYISLKKSWVDFKDIPQRSGAQPKFSAARSFELEIKNAPKAQTFELVKPPKSPFVLLSSLPATFGPTTGSKPATAKFWLGYETQKPGDKAQDDIRIRHKESGRCWKVEITGNTVAARKVAIALALDRSGSMDQLLEDGVTQKVTALRKAASIFVDAMDSGDGLGLVFYNQDATTVLNVTDVQGAGSAARKKIAGLLAGDKLKPDGYTSIGDGVVRSETILKAASGFDDKATVVMTDGNENRPEWLKNVTVTAQTFAVGLGTPQNTSAKTLQKICNGTQGFHLVTGPVKPADQFKLQKYFLQILAGITNKNVIKDPQGNLHPGHEVRIPFLLSTAEVSADVILLTPSPGSIEFELEDPSGRTIGPPEAQQTPGIELVTSQDVAYYRFQLPLPSPDGGDRHQGHWNAVLRRRGPDDEIDPDEDPDEAEAAIPYSLLVHAQSELRVSVYANQPSFEPGAAATLAVSLNQLGISLSDAYVAATIGYPDGTAADVEFAEVGDGRFSATLDTAASGVYDVRLQIQGRTLQGDPFEQEYVRTIPAWAGGDEVVEPRVGPEPGDEPGERQDEAAADPICRRLGWVMRALFAALLIGLGTPWVPAPVLAVAGLALIGVGVWWGQRCTPTPHDWATTAFHGLLAGTAVLAIAWISGLTAAQDPGATRAVAGGALLTTLAFFLTLDRR